MSHTRHAAYIEDEIDGADDCERRWFELRPKPRRRSDFMGFYSRWWMAFHTRHTTWERRAR